MTLKELLRRSAELALLSCREIMIEVGPEDDGTMDEYLTRIDEIDIWAIVDKVLAASGETAA